METTTVLAALLAENRHYSDTYGGGLSNHASMALTSLARLGASDARLRAFWEQARRLLEPLDPHGAEADSRMRFEEALRRDGRDAVLRAELPRLVEGVGAAAFHGVLRTAYALEAEDDAEIAAGLAHWERGYLDLGPPHESPSSPGVDAAYDAAQAVFAEMRVDGDLIFARMAAVGRDPRFGAAAAFGRRPDAFHEAVRLTTTMVAATCDFTALHAMTGTFALRTLVPYVDRDVAFRALWRALVAGYATVGFPVRADTANVTAEDVMLPPWSVLEAAAIASDNDHVIKSVDTCRRIAREGNDAIARTAATRWLRRVKALK